ncbi:hypothetical protein L1987_09078 [Smallanthus sonchifolius]|uniref:Uncharacterized protein n=1 Tax=Smallanthus sonchifolius TaxID=185202 RepID=A0ACB9JPB1_9ASTR|nr:hypothetical protein L1987_09078 [Smallanthus sonchifolius]
MIGRAGLRRLHLFNFERMDNVALLVSLSACPSLLDPEIRVETRTFEGIYEVLNYASQILYVICHTEKRKVRDTSLQCHRQTASFQLARVDLCHQANDENEDDGSPWEALIKKANMSNLKITSQRRCCSFRVFPVGSRQQAVILVTLLILVLMLASMGSFFLSIDLDVDFMEPQLCATMACDIYQHLRASELVEVAEEYRIVPDTLYSTINYIERYLFGNLMDRQRLHLLGVACMMIAS